MTKIYPHKIYSVPYLPKSEFTFTFSVNNPITRSYGIDVTYFLNGVLSNEKTTYPCQKWRTCVEYIQNELDRLTKYGESLSGLTIKYIGKSSPIEIVKLKKKDNVIVLSGTVLTKEQATNELSRNNNVHYKS